jgi:hypothetical protein
VAEEGEHRGVAPALGKEAARENAVADSDRGVGVCVSPRIDGEFATSGACREEGPSSEGDRVEEAELRCVVIHEGGLALFVNRQLIVGSDGLEPLVEELVDQASGYVQ